MRYKGFTEEWNDAGIRSADDVLAALRATVVTDEDLAETFGPQWAAIVALIRRAAALTEREAQDLDAAWDATRDAAWDATRGATRALLVRDLIGQHGFKQHHYNTLVAPWVKVAGPVHPDDQALGEDTQ